MIEALLLSFPNSIQMKNDRGMLPIYLVFTIRVSKRVVYMLLDLFPELINLIDYMNPTTLNFDDEK